MEKDFLRPRRPVRGFLVHRDHEIFVRGIESKKRLRVTFFSDERREELVRRCGPLYHSRPKAGSDDPGCYYLWDFDADEGYNFIALPPERIISMELTEETFTIEHVNSFSKGPAASSEGPDSAADS